MIDATNSQCRECQKKRRRATCFRVEVSRLEEGLGHEKFKCEACGQMYKLIPDKGIVKVSV